MEHQQIRGKLLMAGDAEWPEEERREVTDHLKECAECRMSWARWRNIHGALIRGAPAAGDGEVFVSRVMGRLADLETEAEKKGSIFSRVQQWIFPAVGYAFAFGIMFMAITHWRPYLGINPTTEKILLTDVSQNEQTLFSRNSPDISNLYISR